MLLINRKLKLFGLVSLIIFFSVLTACNNGSSSTTANPNVEQLVISSPTKSNINIDESENFTISISNRPSNESVTVIINSNNSSVITVSPNYCILSIAESSCITTVTGVSSGSATFSASAVGIESVNSESITVIPNTGILFGNMGGLVFNNNTILPGSSALSVIDDSQVQGLVIDSNNNIYAGTFGNTFNGFGAGKVFKYESNKGYWEMLPGNGQAGSLDNSSVNILAVDSNNNIYAATEAGNVFIYKNSIWTLLGVTLNNPIYALAIDSNNNIFAGTQNDGDVFKYVNGNWQSLGSPDGTNIKSIAINSSGDLYAATNGDTDGQVYKYITGTTWNAISSFNDGSINVVAVNNTEVFAGTNNGKVYRHLGGTSWNQLGAKPDDTAIMALTVVESDIYAGTQGSEANGQVYHYNNPLWGQIGTLNNGAVSVISEKNNHLFIGTSNAGGVSIGMAYEYDNEAWLPIGKGALDGTPVYSTTIDNSGNFYAGTLNNVYKYTQNSTTWAVLGNISAIDSSGVNALVTYESIIYAGTFSGNVLRSNINFGNWAKIKDTISNTTISSLLVSSSGQLFASINANTDSEPNDGTVWKYSSSNGTWLKLTGSGSEGSIDSTTIQSLSLDSLGNLYAATAGTGNGGFVWKYPANTSTWQLLGLGTLDGSAVQVVKAYGDSIYAGTYYGNIFKYNGSYWIKLNDYPIDNSGISNILFIDGANLYATTLGGLIWQYVESSNSWNNTSYGIGISINNGGGSGF